MGMSQKCDAFYMYICITIFLYPLIYFLLYLIKTKSEFHARKKADFRRFEEWQFQNNVSTIDRNLITLNV